jgi:hypothetical protein
MEAAIDPIGREKYLVVGKFLGMGSNSLTPPAFLGMVRRFGKSAPVCVS